MEPIEEKVSQEDLASYYAAYSDPFVVHLRRSLDNYLAGSREGMESFEFVTQPHLPGRRSGLKAFKEYFKSKFVVVWLADAIMGGKEVTCLFRDKPDTLICFWLYRLGGTEEYDLRGVWEKTDIDKEGLKAWTNQNSGLVFSDPHCL